MRSPLRVCWFSSYIEEGGVLSLLAGLSRHLDPRRVRLTYAYWSSTPELVRSVFPPWVELRFIPGLDRLRSHPREGLARISTELRRRPFEVVHSHLLKSDILAAWALPPGTPQVASIYGELSPPWNGWSSRAFYRAAIPWVRKRVRRWVAVCEASARDAFTRHGIARERVRVIYPGVNAPAEIPSRVGRRGFVVGALSRLVPEKGLSDLLFALAGAPEVRVEIAGSGPEEVPLRNLATRLGLVDRARFLGRVPDVSAFWSSVDAAVFPSRAEGLPLAVAEAMLCARPVIAARVGGIPEMIADGREGMLVAPSSVEGLRHAILALAADPGRAAETGRRARVRASKQFDPARAAIELVETYADTLEAREVAA